MQYGVIKSIAPDRGFGFIDTGGYRDVYFHATEIGDDVFQKLSLNQPVMFEFVKRAKKDERDQDKGPRAALIKLIDKLPGGILPRPTQDIAPRHHPKARQRKATWKRKIDVRGKTNE